MRGVRAALHLAAAAAETSSNTPRTLPFRRGSAPALPGAAPFSIIAWGKSFSEQPREPGPLGNCTEVLVARIPSPSPPLSFWSPQEGACCFLAALPQSPSAACSGGYQPWGLGSPHRIYKTSSFPRTQRLPDTSYRLQHGPSSNAGTPPPPTSAPQGKRVEMRGEEGE